jgi:uncharacterized OsmC-like protein
MLLKDLGGARIVRPPPGSLTRGGVTPIPSPPSLLTVGVAACVA